MSIAEREQMELTPAMAVELESALLRMTEIVDEGRWIRNSTESAQAYDGGYRSAHCALGLITKVKQEGVLSREHDETMRRLLVSVITPEELQELYDLKTGDQVNGGFVGSHGTPESPHTSGMVASYNNTRRGESEIVHWFDRAIRACRMAG